MVSISNVVLRGLGVREEGWEAEGISMVVFSGLAGEVAGIMSPFSVGCVSCCTALEGTTWKESTGEVGAMI